MFKKIVVPLDGSPEAERAVFAAKAVAERAGVPVELVASHRGGVIFFPKKYLRGVADQAHIDDYRVRTSHNCIQHLLDEIAADDEVLVCMTSDCKSDAYQRAFGSIATDLLRRTNAAFLVLGPRTTVAADWRPERLVVCTDGSAASRAIVPFAADFMHALGTSVRVVNVVDPDTEEFIRESEGDVDESSAARSIAVDLGDGSSVDWEVLHHRDAARAILDDAGHDDNTVIAMATHGRSGLARVLMGSTTVSVFRHAMCPVLVVRPENLRSD